ncbi:MAG: NUDIX domain-containing protein [Lachnospiraceae bacterium]|nr:NUDIX domain-containing protein [Lachnospiraceae bacterium]
MKPFFNTTLCYIEKDGQFLMLYRNKKKRDLNGGKWIGVGGKFEPGENAEECMVREVKEETGLTLTHWHFYGIVRFISEVEDNDMYLYTADGFTGEVNPSCSEGELCWVDKDKVLSLPTWEGDHYFLEKILAGEKRFDMTLEYDEHDWLIEVSDGLKPFRGERESGGAEDGVKDEDDGGRRKRSMTILVDMDDTIEQLLQTWVSDVNARYGTHAVVDDVKSWDVTKAFPGLTRQQVYEIPDEPGFWGRVKPVPGAVEGLQKLIADGHDIYIVTATQYESLAEKMSDLLFKYFPFISWRQVIVTKRKQMIRGDVLIDDGPHNLEGGEYEKILVDASHNRDYDEKAHGMIRVKNWDEILKAVDRIAERYASEEKS